MEHKTRIDARTIRTKDKIRFTFEEMILEMDMDKITVSELTKRAYLDRKTFYLHYESITEIFEELATDISSEIIDLLKDAAKDLQNMNFDVPGKTFIIKLLWKPLLYF